MGVFGAVCRRSGDAGFIGPLLGVSGGVVGFTVAMFLRPVRDIVRPALPGVWVRARKSSPSTRKMAQNGCFMPSWGNFFAEMRLEGPSWANFFAEMRLEGPYWASIFADQQRWNPRRASLLRRAPGTGALLLAPLTL